MNRFRLRNVHRRRGATLALVAILLPVMLVLAAFAINLSYMELNRTELRISTDAAARAAIRTYAATGNKALATQRGQQIAERNPVAGEPLTLAQSDFVFGQSHRSSLDSRYTFTPSNGYVNAVQITGRRTPGAPDGPVSLLFPNMLGRQTFEPQQTAIASQTEVDIALVIDRSGSMAFADNEKSSGFNKPKAAPKNWDYCDPVPNKSRWLDAVGAVDLFVAELDASPGLERVSLSTYSSDATLDIDLTTDYTKIRNRMNAISQKFCGGSTNVGGGLQKGLDSIKKPGLARPWAAKIVVVMTDGIHNTGTDPLPVANQAGKDGIMVYSVTFSNEADIVRMQKVASAGHGTHMHAATGNDLKKIFQEIAKSLPTLLTQ